MCLVDVYLQHKSEFLTIVQSHEIMTNIKISNFWTFLGAEAIKKVIPVPTCVTAAVGSHWAVE